MLFYCFFFVQDRKQFQYLVVAFCYYLYYIPTSFLPPRSPNRRKSSHLSNGLGSNNDECGKESRLILLLSPFTVTYLVVHVTPCPASA